jgi:hypothetical protein
MGRVRPSEGLASRQIDDEWILLDLNGGNYYGLDEVGGTVWELLKQGKNPQEISDAMVERYVVSHGTLLADVVAFVNDLVDRGLVRPIEDGPSHD